MEDTFFLSEGFSRGFLPFVRGLARLEVEGSSPSSSSSDSNSYCSSQRERRDCPHLPWIPWFTPMDHPPNTREVECGLVVPLILYEKLAMVVSYIED